VSYTGIGSRPQNLKKEKHNYQIFFPAWHSVAVVSLLFLCLKKLNEAYVITLLCVHVSLLGNGSVNIFA
jgi:hypothetical protein